MFLINYRRFSGSTAEAAGRVVELLEHVDYKCAALSTSSKMKDGNNKHEDGPETNWPYLCGAIRVGDDVHIFDSTLLNASRQQRGAEVRVILDVAQTKDKCYFIPDPGVGFTASLSAQEAAMRFTGRELTALTPSTRGHFWLQLAHGIPEHEFFKT